MATLDRQGRMLLQLLAEHLKGVRVGDPATYISYKQVHDKLGLQLQRGSTYGISLQHQGLNSLADWASKMGLPAITGLIVAEDTRLPGEGYAKLLGFKELDFDRWKSEIENATMIDWDRYILSI